MNIYDRRWFAVLNWARKVETLREQGYILWFADQLLVNTELVKYQFEIDEVKRIVRVIEHHIDTCIIISTLLYEGDPAWDHGAHDTITSTLARLNGEVKFFKEVAIDL